jgi:hypothetical protein
VSPGLDRRLLATYLNDHLAGATAGRELVRRSAGANRGNSYGAVLAELAGEIESDRRQLEALMRGLDIGVDRLKVAGGWLGEKLGRLKPNGRLLGYSPLSRLVELEVLSLAVQGKLSLWRSLRAVADEDPTLAAVDFDRLIERAQRQLRTLGRQRLQAAREALAGQRG